ncbi:response regulator [Methylobacterium planeticum]|uniref:Response regulator n=1 Tax=Methylobacterium planeticum TaxID=2615211 RepID=A0A6N6MTV4_9HYPH|nr:response regulator [Methylobacterium planeticum]KAB1074067.1 response regulator [Methylobacterium planeticum]
MAHRHRQPQVLLLSGDELTRLLTTSGLEGYGYEVRSARTAAEAEAILRDEEALRHIHVLVTDADVRDASDGLALASLARRLRPSIHVIYTARQPHRISAAHKVAGAPCLRTPYHPHQLAGIISGLQATVAPSGGQSQKAA